jgi:hypothetical protein
MSKQRIAFSKLARLEETAEEILIQAMKRFWWPEMLGDPPHIWGDFTHRSPKLVWAEERHG